jgi:hypothetical protein
MPIVPHRLQGITTDNLKSSEVKTVIGVTNFRPDDVSEHVRFAAAGRAWTRPPKKLEIDIRFSSVIPTDRQFVTDLLDIRWLQTHWDFNITTMRSLGAIPGLEGCRGACLKRLFI